eukprot:IDg22096t1
MARKIHLKKPVVQPTDQAATTATGKFAGEVFLFTSPNYKINLFLAVRPVLLSEQVAVLDTGAGPNCVRIDALPTGASRHIQQRPLPSVQDANKKLLATLGIVALYIQAGEIMVRTDFLVCQNLSVPIII